MNNHRFVSVRLLAVLCVTLFFSCQSGVYLDEIDKTAEVDASVALPIGRISFPLKAFLGHMQITDDIYIEPNMEEAARLELKYHGKFLRPYTYLGENFDRELYTTNSLPSVLIGQEAVQNGKSQYDQQITVSVPVTFSDINTESFFRSVGRLDSVLIADAGFELIMSLKGGLASQSDKITAIKITSDDITLSAPIEFTSPLSFGVPMQKNMQNFSINFMKDRHLLDNGTNLTLEDCENNVNRGVTLDVTLYSGNTPITVSADDEIAISLSLETTSYAAVWGWFHINSKQRDNQTIRLEDELPSGEDKIGWKDIKALNLPLAEPSITMTVAAEIAAPMNLEIKGISVNALNEDGTVKETRKATFNNGSETYTWPIITDAMLVNYATEIYNKTYSNSITFDENRGHLDELFQARPDEVSYEYEVVLEENSKHYLQQRVSDQDGVDLDVDVVLPFVFNKGLNLHSPDFTFDLSLSSINVEQAEIDIDLQDLNLILDMENTLPLGVQVVYAFLDSEGNKLDFHNILGSDENTEGGDTLSIPASVDIDSKGLPNLENPAKATHRIRFDQTELDRIGDIEKMQITAIIKTDDAAFEHTDRVVVTQEEGIAITVKASAALKAIIDLNESKD